MRYESPTSTREAIALMSKEKGDAYLLAGGTDLLIKMKRKYDTDEAREIGRKIVKFLNEYYVTAKGNHECGYCPNSYHYQKFNP